jgi:hypothetical protein
MRLLDQVAQCSEPCWVQAPDGERPIRLPGANDYAKRVASCPLRYVLTDEITAMCAQLALARGDRLSGCLDLIHLPAPQMWVEWNDAPRAQVMEHVYPGKSIANRMSLEASEPSAQFPVRAGVLISAARDGRRGMLKTFWSDGGGILNLAPAETHLDLESGWPATEVRSPFDGGWVRISAPDPGLESLLNCMRFRIDPQWARYYQRYARDAGCRAEVLRSTIATVACDMPVALAFCLMLGANNALESRSVERSRLNRSRTRKGKPCLLDYVEVCCPLLPTEPCTTHERPANELPSRRRRLHFVRGHLVRRHNQLHWRVAHLRGRASLGVVKARTITLSFPQRQAPAT